MKQLISILMIALCASCSPSVYGDKFTVIAAQKSKDPAKTLYCLKVINYEKRAWYESGKYIWWQSDQLYFPKDTVQLLPTAKKIQY